MKINKFRLILWLTVIILILITYNAFSKTLALFEDNANGEVENDIGKWVIKINDNLISTPMDEDITIDSFVYDISESVESGYIAPGSSAYFDLIFDATQSDVAVKYDIAFDFSSMEYSDNISISVEEVGTNNTVLTAENTYSGVISLDSILNNDLITLRVHVTWEDIEDYNESDTSLGTQIGSKLIVPISVHAEQYLGEEIIRYTGE